jgi:hypothetical protein
MIEEYLWEQVVGSRLCIDKALVICGNDDGVRLDQSEQCFHEQCGDHLFWLCQFLLAHKCDPSKIPYFHQIHLASIATSCERVMIPPLPGVSELLEQGRG